jgi:hypothetical protein
MVEEFPSAPPTLISVNEEDLTHSLAYKLLGRLSRDVRKEYLLDLIRELEDLGTLSIMLRKFSSQTWAPVFLPDELLKEVQSSWLERIRKAAAGGVLGKEQKLIHILFAWSEFTGFDELRTFIESLVASDEGLLNFLVACLTRVVSEMGYRVVETWRIRRRTVAQFIQPDKLRERVIKLRETKGHELSQTQKTAVEEFLKALERDDNDFFER